ncbi:MAG: hypothetical protein WCC36_05400 [Gammaproteobacteria bacterium]
MKRLWLVWVAAAMAMAAGMAMGGTAQGDAVVVAAPVVPGGGFHFQQVRDWDHGGDRHHHRGWGRRGDRDGRVHTRIFLGFGNAWDPGWGPYWGPPPYYYYNPPVVVTQPPPPTVYIEPQRESKPYYWYYCESAKRYYPYVKQCPGGWMKVVPHGPRD